MNSKSKEIVELSDGWVRCRSKSNPGRQYYFNRKTGNSSWTQPQPDEKLEKQAKKMDTPNKIQEKPKREEVRNEPVKRKSDGFEPGSSKKKHKNETPEKSSKKDSPISVEVKAKLKNVRSKKRVKRKSFTKSPSKCKALSNLIQKTSPAQKKVSPKKNTPTKNLANNRLSQLRNQLNEEAKIELDKQSSPKINKNNSESNESLFRPKTELRSPVNQEPIRSITSKSPSSDNLHSIPSPSQFFAANKIIHSMKAQLPEEYSKKEKPKDTFADIEQGICNQITEYPIVKHPSTPPQFFQASKLVSAIKSKLSYTPKEIKTFSSAKDRMEVLRASVSGEIDELDLQDDSKSNPEIHQTSLSNVQYTPSTPPKCEAMEVEDIRETIEAPKPSSHHNEKNPGNGQVVLVVDTNIFIHELEFIKDVLNSHLKGYSEQPMLLVPWRVINELDRLKDNNNGNGAICKRARAAMDYLYKSLPENSRIKGQTLRDANSHIYPCESPDDEILNCALQQAERGRNVVLLSNDKNLCNKASVNGIRRISIAELKLLVEHRRPDSEPDLFAQFKHYEQTIYQLLANILENEMRAKYNNLWLHVLFKAPPWGLSDVLQCLLKHWIAVFNEVFPRIEHLIASLKNKHRLIEDKDPQVLTESEVGYFKELCLDVAQKCQIIPEYMELAKLTVDRLAQRVTEKDDERARHTVVAAFEALWGIMSSYCAKLATAVGIPHTLEDNIPASETLSNLTSKFEEFYHFIANFVLTIQEVLRIDDKSLDMKICQLEAAFRECFQRTDSEHRLNREDLRVFCLTNKNMLHEAHSKFTELFLLLGECKKTAPLLRI